VVLQVPFGEFGETAKRVLGHKCDAYLCRHGERTVATAAIASMSSVVVAILDKPLEEARKLIEAQGLSTHEGRWSDDLVLQELEEGPAETFVAGIAYKSDTGTPGIWIDAFPQLPTQVQVLRAMYEEVKETGEMSEVSFEEFVRLAEANVVIATPEDLKGYMAAKVIDADPEL
jgi:hypothetical protein